MTKKNDATVYLDNVADIDDESIWYRLDPNPLAIGLPFHIKATSAVLIKDSKGAGIFVTANTEREVGIGTRRVVIERNEGCLFLKEDI